METEAKVGPIGQVVAENVKAYRSRRHFSLRDLSAKLAELGRPILPSGITKIEHGARRVDADDLVALGWALDVSPPRLLLPSGKSTDDFLSEIETYEKSGALEPLTQAMLTAVDQHAILPGWLVEYVDYSSRWILLLREAMKERGEEPGALTSKRIHEVVKKKPQARG